MIRKLPTSYRNTEFIEDKPLLAQIKAAIGDDAHDDLLAALGGTQLYVPAKIGEHHPIAVSAGMEAAAILSSQFAGLTLMLPVTLKKRAAIIDALKSNTPVLQIAKNVYCSPRFVWKVKAELAASQEPDQLGLL